MIRVLALRRLALRPTAAAIASVAALGWLAVVVPHQTLPSLPAGRAALPPPQPALPPRPGVRVMTVTGSVPQAPPAGRSVTVAVDHVPNDAEGPVAQPCEGVRTSGAVRVIAAPTAASSVWAQAASLADSDPGHGSVSDHTDRTPYANVVATNGAAPISFLVPGGAPGSAFASDGTALVRSTDGGCTWQPVLTLDPTSTPASIVSAVSSGSVVSVAPGYVLTTVVARDRDVYATVAPPWWSPMYAGAADVAPLVVAISHDGGNTWRASVPIADQPVYLHGTQVSTAAQSLPAGSGWPQLVAVAADDPGVVYLETAAHADATGAATVGPTRMRMFRSADGGITWTAMSAPVRPGAASMGTGLYAAGTTETYLSQLRVDAARPDVVYGLGVETPPGTTSPGANGLDGADTQNGLFQSDGTLFAWDGSRGRWQGLASPLGATGYDGATMVYVDSFAASATGRDISRVALVEHSVNVAGHTLTYSVFTSADGARHWQELPPPDSLAVFLPAEDAPSDDGTYRPLGGPDAPLHQDGVFAASQPVWLSLLPDNHGLSLGVDPAPGVCWGSVSVYDWRWPPLGSGSLTGWVRVGRAQVAPTVQCDVRNWNFNPSAPAIDLVAGTAYAVVQCRSAVNNSMLATADATAGIVDVEAQTYTGPIYLVSFGRSGRRSSGITP